MMMKKRFVFTVLAIFVIALPLFITCLFVTDIHADSSRNIYVAGRVNDDATTNTGAVAELKLGELTFQGTIMPPLVQKLTVEEMNALILETMKEFNMDDSDLRELSLWGASLELRVFLQGELKILKIFSNYLPGAAGEVFSSGSLIYQAVDSAEKGGKGYDQIASSAAGLVAGHELGKLDTSKLKYANVPGYGSLVIGTIGAGMEAMDNTQYDQFVSKSEKKFQKAAEFFAALSRRIKKAVEEKNKSSSGGTISFLPVSAEIDGKTLYGINVGKVRYTLSGMLKQEDKGERDFFELQDMSGVYTGELTLMIEPVDLSGFDSVFADQCNLCDGSPQQADEWRQILKRFPDYPEFRKNSCALFMDSTLIRTRVVRILTGEFTASVSSSDGLGPVQLSGAFNNVSDETEFDFGHSIHYIYLWEIKTEDGKHNYGQPDVVITLTSDLGTGIGQIHASAKGNEAVKHTNDAAYVMFEGDGRSLIIPVEKQGDIFDQIKFAPEMTIKAAE